MSRSDSPGPGMNDIPESKFRRALRRAALPSILVGSGALLGTVGTYISNPAGIVNVPADYFPWDVYINTRGGCGGVIVQEGWVLTAAHCVCNARKTKRYFRVETRTGNPRSHDANGESVLIHKDYKSRGDEPSLNDLALVPVPTLKLQPSDPMVASIGLATESDEQPLIDLFVVGRNCGSPIRSLTSSLGIGEVCGNLVYTDVPVETRADCDSRFGNNPRFFCAGGEGIERAGIGPHDSGGGLVTATRGAAKLVGIASRATNDRGDVYSRVSQYKTDWIQPRLAGQHADEPVPDECRPEISN